MNAGSKRLVMVRHAHRDTEERARDNGISDKGKEQVKKLVDFAKKRLEGDHPLFLTSPKKRCIETISPIAKAFEQKAQIDARLDENSSQIDEFLDFWKYEGPDTLVICSHGDWIPIAVQKLTKAQVGIKKAGWIELEYVNGGAYLTWIVQKV